MTAKANKVQVYEELIHEDTLRRPEASAIYFYNQGTTYVQIDEAIFLAPGESYTEADVGDDILDIQYKIRFHSDYGEGERVPLIITGNRLWMRIMVKDIITNPNSTV